MFVTGCHRSGTSLLASLVRGLISTASNPAEDELPPALDNPRGFQESKPLNQLNNHLLKLANCRWDRPPLLLPDWSSPPFFSELFEARDRFADLALKRNWVEKNPRLCITAGAMEHLLLRRVPLLAVLREPQPVALSLFRRNGLPIEQGLMLWFLYNHHLARQLRDGDLLLSYDTLKAGGSALLHRLTNHLQRQGLPLVEHTDHVLRMEIDPSLDRSQETNFKLAGPAEELAATCIDRYQRVCDADAEINKFQAAFADLPSSLLSVLAERGVWHWHNRD